MWSRLCERVISVDGRIAIGDDVTRCLWMIELLVFTGTAGTHSYDRYYRDVELGQVQAQLGEHRFVKGCARNPCYSFFY